jgi:hypothetical protein
VDAALVSIRSQNVAGSNCPWPKGSIDCDESGGKDASRGLVEVCGALSGTYKLEIIANAGSDCTLTISARSQEVRDGQHLWSSYSDYDLISIPIRKGSRNFISVTYSRDPNLRVAAQLQKLRMSDMKPASIRTHVGVGIRDSEAV